MTSYLARYGNTLVRNGYSVIPIEAGTKHPPRWMSHKNSDPWSEVRPSVERVAAWIADRRLPGAGLGIVCREVGGLDLDIRDPGVAAEMVRWCEDNLGDFPPHRIGQPPKRLLVFRTDTEIRKQTSVAYKDDEGRKCQVEFLARGEQFVAYAVHPDTGKPYEWVGGQGPHNTPVSALPVITPPQIRACIAAFEAMAKARGWERYKSATTGAMAAADTDDWTNVVDQGPTEHTLEQVREVLFAVPNDGVDGTQDYDVWQWIGAALYHQTEGSAEGLALWKSWSQQSSKHIESECDKKWRSFDITDKDRKPLTFRWLLKITEEARREKAGEGLEEAKAALAAATTPDAVRKAAAKVKPLDIDNVERESFAVLVQQRILAINGTKIPVAMARAMVRFEVKGEQTKPEWVDGWVYISGSHEFFNTANGTAVTPAAFDSLHARHVLTAKDLREGRAFTEARPSDLALNIYRIPLVHQRIYMPGQGVTLKVNGVDYVNTYTAGGVPKVPAEMTATDRENLQRTQNHFAWMFPDERERGLLISFLSSVVKGKRVRWATVIHGVEGNGKTFIFDMMGLLLGKQNVKSIAPRELEKEFTSWAEGSQFSVIEEIKVAHGRFDVMNSLKPHITNNYVSVRRMRTDAYMVPNTATYLALTNYADALPIEKNDRRYMVLASAPRSGDVMALPPDYFQRLFDALETSPGAIRGWLLNYEPHPDFDANGRAPVTAHKQRMVDLAESDEVRMIRACLDKRNGEPGMTETLLRTDLLSEKLMDDGEAVPATRSMSRALMDMGLVYLGRARASGEKTRWWSKTPSRFLTDGDLDMAKIQDWLEPDI